MTVKTIPALEARVHLGEIMKRSITKGENFIIEKSGIPAVVIMNIKDYEEYKQLMEERDKDFEVINRIRSKMPDMTEKEITNLVSESINAVRKKKNA